MVLCWVLRPGFCDQGLGWVGPGAFFCSAVRTGFCVQGFWRVGLDAGWAVLGLFAQEEAAIGRVVDMAMRPLVVWRE